MKFIKLIFSRFAITSLLIIIQTILFCLGIYYLSERFVYFSFFARIIGILVLLYLINKEGNPNHKIPWMVVILLFPIGGLAIFFLFGSGYVTKKHRALYQSVADRQKDILIQDEKIMEELEDVSASCADQSKYIYATSKTPICKNTSLKYLSSGEEYFKQLFIDLKNAKKFIFIETFILSEGKLLDAVVSLLVEKAKEGLDVRVIYDDIGSMRKLPHNYDKLLRSFGIKCIKFNPYIPIVSVVYNNRDHRKITVIDGIIGYTGGANIADEYVNIINPHGKWKDSGIRLMGEAVKNFTMMFLETYDVYSNERDDFSLFIPEFFGDFPAEECFVQPFADGPQPVYKYYIGENVYLNIINQAKDYVYITTPYLIIDYVLENALLNAALRGVDVRIITPGIPDKKIVYTLTRSSYEALVKGGIKIYEYKPGFIHAKNVISDDKVSVVGTINFDYRSLVHHFECACYMVNKTITKEIKEDFLNTLKDCIIPPKKSYHKKSIIARIYVSVLRFFAPLM